MRPQGIYRVLAVSGLSVGRSCLYPEHQCIPAVSGEQHLYLGIPFC
jgi:hypothetical protein